MFFLEKFDSFQLDVVGFLAILGEGSVLATAQVSTLSYLSYLPRLIPAPHALLRCNRPNELPSHEGKVVSVYAGNVRDHVRFFPHVLHEPHPLLPNGVKCLRIVKVRNTPPVKARAIGILPFVEISATLISIALLVLSIVLDDGMALVATLLLSLLSTLIGVTNKWDLSGEFQTRDETRDVPSADLVVYYPKGFFYVIRCDEEVARELYLPPARDTNYKLADETLYRGLSLCGTLMLMLGVVALANATLPLQIAYGAAYLVLNIMYWAAGTLKPGRHWDLSRFQVTTERDEGNGEELQFQEGSFTVALWRAIALAGSARWARVGQIAPQTAKWDAWLQQADDAAKIQKKEQVFEMNNLMNQDAATPSIALPQWDAREALTNIMKNSDI